MKKINNLRFLPRISEAEKRRRNPTYRNARKSYTKNLLFFFPVWIILLIVLVFVITNIENRILAGIVGLFLAASPIMGLGIACNLSLRLWVCPHCGKELPVQHIQYVSLPVYTAQCPGCGYSLEETIPSSHLHRLPVSKIRGLIKKGSFRPWFSVFFCLCALYLC